MKYEFIEFIRDRKATYDGMRITSRAIILTKSLFSRMGNPEFISIKYDKKNNAVAFKKVSGKIENGYKVYHTTYNINCALSKEMPLGKYIYIAHGVNSDFICVKE